MNKNEKKMLFWIPILFTIHNLEEFLFFSPPQFKELPFTPPAFILSLQNELSRSTYTIALVLVTALAWVIWSFSLNHKNLKIFLYVLQATMLLNFFSHSLSVLFSGRYQMGIVTALLINLPFFILLFRKAAKQGWINQRQTLPILVGAVFFHGPLLFFILWISSLISGLV